MMNINLIFVCGYICSGKTTYSKKLEKELNYLYVENSSVVRKLINSNKRSELQNTSSLDITISESHIDTLLLYNNVIISGVRQKSIIDTICNYFIKRKAFFNFNVEYVWLHVTKEELLKRFYDNTSSKLEDISFDDALKNDDKLGVSEIREYIYLNSEKPNFKIITNTGE